MLMIVMRIEDDHGDEETGGGDDVQDSNDDDGDGDDDDDDDDDDWWVYAGNDEMRTMSLLMVECLSQQVSATWRKQRHSCTSRLVPAIFAMFEMGSCPACRKLARGRAVLHRNDDPILPKTRTVTRIVASTGLVIVSADSPGRGGPGGGYHGGEVV